MLQKVSILILLLLCYRMPAQKASAELNLSALNFTQLEHGFIERLNQLRKDQKLDILTKDPILDKAAADQAAYQKQKHRLTHDQDVKAKEKPRDRVFYYHGTHDQVGENCIVIPLKQTFTPKYSKKDLVINTYAEAAEALFMGWKTSPAHYKNMIEPVYEVYGLSFSFDKDSSRLYCTQVFAVKQFVFSSEMQSPADAFGVKDPLPNSCNIFNTEQARRALRTFEIVRGPDSIYIRCEEASQLKIFFNHPADGIYFDLVQRNQFNCGKNNQLHGSPIYDGKMLPPVLFKDILKRNRMKDGKNLYASVCATPALLKNKNIRLNYGFIKNGYSCGYTYLVSAPENNLQMLNLYPKWVYQPNQPMQPDSFKGTLSFTIPFERNEVSLNEKQQGRLKGKLEIYRPFITDVDLQTFSSVEGSSQTNLKLQEQRAATIHNIVKPYYNDSLSIRLQTSENWNDFFALIENTQMSYLKELPKEKIKEKLRSKPLLDSLDFLLRISRCARLDIGLKAFIDDNSDPYLILAAYKKSIESNDSLKAFNQQNKLLEHVTHLRFESGDLLPIEIPLTRKFLPHLTNYLAVSVKDQDMLQYAYTRNLALRASKIDPNYLPIKFNLCILSLKYMQAYGDTLLPVPELEACMNACFKLGTAEDSIIVNHMWLNYSLLSLYSCWERHLYQTIDKHLFNAKKYYPGARISENEAIDLGLLFNLYSRHGWTCELLYPYVKDKTKNEDLLFLFNETYATMGGGNLSADEWRKYLHKAKKMNPDRFHRWIDETNYQLLRMETIKKEFCED